MLVDFDKEQCELVAVKLKLDREYIRKDYFVTKAIHTLSMIKNDYFALAFKGGTCLVKAHKVINRLSEDVDYRVVVTPAGLALTVSNRRKKLRDFRHQIVDALKTTGFQINAGDVKVMYEGHYMTVAARFPDGDQVSYLKPHIAIECFLGDIKLPLVDRSVTNLIKETLEEECNHPVINIACYSLEETAVEKWVALTRRIYGTLERQRRGDGDLVRHIYDLHQLQSKNMLHSDYVNLIHTVVKNEQSFFSKEKLAFDDGVINMAKIMLYELQQNQEWEKRWQLFTQRMVYDDLKPSYNEAFKSLEVLSNRLVEALQSDLR